MCATSACLTLASCTGSKTRTGYNFEVDLGRCEQYIRSIRRVERRRLVKSTASKHFVICLSVSLRILSESLCMTVITPTNSTSGPSTDPEKELGRYLKAASDEYVLTSIEIRQIGRMNCSAYTALECPSCACWSTLWYCADLSPQHRPRFAAFVSTTSIDRKEEFERYVETALMVDISDQTSNFERTA